VDDKHTDLKVNEDKEEIQGYIDGKVFIIIFMD
jgi:hypothetical protein